MVLDGFAIGLLARSHEGRPTKIEGNPEHPASLGATGVYEQASVLDLYDPARVRAVHEDGAPSSWQQALTKLNRPASFRPWIVLPPQSSPLVATLLDEIRRRFPACHVCFDSPLDRRRYFYAVLLHDRATRGARHRRAGCSRRAFGTGGPPAVFGGRHTPLELGVLYWHLVDVIWIFLWPLMYLAG